MSLERSESAPAVTVALLGSKEVGRELGKRGTVSDLTLFNSVRESQVVTYVEPTQFPDRLPPLLFALAMADRALFFVSALDHEMAETAAAVDLFELPALIVVGPSLDVDQLNRALRGSSLEGAPRCVMDLLKVREIVEQWTAPAVEGPVGVTLDHAFPVKGVGAVALGLVRQGTLRIHDTLRVYPTDRTVEVRSIQVQDVDVREAPTGRRVGVALKGIDTDELARGQVLAPEGSMTVAQDISPTGFQPCRYYRGKIVEGSSLHLLAGLQFVPARVVRLHKGVPELTTDRSIAYRTGDRGLLCDLSVASGPRLAGRLAMG